MRRALPAERAVAGREAACLSTVAAGGGEPVVFRRAAAALPTRGSFFAFARAPAEAPTIPWARLRWAPNDAGRVNVLPHSGQTNCAVSCVVVERLRGLI